MNKRDRIFTGFVITILTVVISLPFVLADESRILVNMTSTEENNSIKFFSEKQQKYVEVESKHDLDYLVDKNGNVYLNFTINNFVELEKEFEECTLSECEVLLKLHDVFKEFAEEQKKENNSLLEFLGIIIPSIMVIIGILYARRLSEQSRIKTLNEEIAKIRIYVNSDFATVKRMVDQQKNQLEEYLKTIQTTNIIQKYTDELLLLKSPPTEKLSQVDYLKQLVDGESEYKKFIKSVKLRIKFTFWNMLENASAILKLKEDEVKILETSHHLMEEFRKRDEDSWTDFVDEITGLVRKESSRVKIEKSLKLKLILKLNEMISLLDIIQKHLSYVDTIEWVDLTKEILTPEVSKIIQKNTVNP